MATFSRTLGTRYITGLLCAVPVVTALGCGADFDSPDRLKHCVCLAYKRIIPMRRLPWTLPLPVRFT
jgi:hypothetical protein